MDGSCLNDMPQKQKEKIAMLMRTLDKQGIEVENGEKNGQLFYSKCLNYRASPCKVKK